MHDRASGRQQLRPLTPPHHRCQVRPKTQEDHGQRSAMGKCTACTAFLTTKRTR